MLHSVHPPPPPTHTHTHTPNSSHLPSRQFSISISACHPHSEVANLRAGLQLVCVHCTQACFFPRVNFTCQIPKHKPFARHNNYYPIFLRLLQLPAPPAILISPWLKCQFPISVNTVCMCSYSSLCVRGVLHSTLSSAKKKCPPVRLVSIVSTGTESGFPAVLLPTVHWELLAGHMGTRMRLVGFLALVCWILRVLAGVVSPHPLWNGLRR